MFSSVWSRASRGPISRRILPLNLRPRKKCNVHLENTDKWPQTPGCKLVEGGDCVGKGEGRGLDITRFHLVAPLFTLIIMNPGNVECVIFTQSRLGWTITHPCAQRCIACNKRKIICTVKFYICTKEINRGCLTLSSLDSSRTDRGYRIPLVIFLLPVRIEFASYPLCGVLSNSCRGFSVEI